MNTKKIDIYLKEEKMSTIKPYNNRLLIEKVEEKEKKIGDLFVPDFVKDRKDIPKFLRVKVIEQSPDLTHANLVNKNVIIETGFLEEVVVDDKVYMFCPYNYVVCSIE